MSKEMTFKEKRKMAEVLGLTIQSINQLTVRAKEGSERSIKTLSIYQDAFKYRTKDEKE